VANSQSIEVGQWVRLWMPAADNTRRRRRLLSEDALPEAGVPQRGGRKLRQAAVPAGKVTVLGTERPVPDGKVTVLNTDTATTTKPAAPVVP
jgi:hypothetical protein